MKGGKITKETADKLKSAGVDILNLKEKKD